jgi:dienelactone hydrolase
MNRLLSLSALLLVANLSSAEVKTKAVDYTADGVTCKGFVAWDDAIPGKRPGVVVVHEWWGLNEDAKNRAKMLAGLGYVALCADMYGEGALTEHPSKAGEMATAVRKNIDTWRGRAKAAIEKLQSHENVDKTRIAIMGYCFGGSTSLQIAMTGHPDVKAAISFHGALPTPTVEEAKKIKCKVLVCHGADDSFIKPETIAKFKEAFDGAKVDYTFESYPGAKHSFTVKGIDDKAVKGLEYNAEADKKSWDSLQKVLKEAFGK